MLIVLVLVVSLLLIYTFNRSSNSETPSESAGSSTNELSNSEDPNLIRIIAGGDFLPHDSVNLNATTSSGYDYKQFFEPIRDQFDTADVAFCNQESPSAQDLNISGFPIFNAPRDFATDISEVGCNLISLANNHLFDKGKAGIDGTRELWDEINPLAISGANRNQKEQNKVSYFEVKGTKFAFVAFSEISNQPPTAGYSLNRLDSDLVNNLLTEARDNADIVIVGAHWGTEYSSAINSEQERWAQTFSDLGADIVFGSGPHVIQPVKKLKKDGGGETIVFYSLGNLLSTQLDIESLIGGLASIDIDTDKKEVTAFSFYPTYMHYEWTAQEKANEDLLKRNNLKIYPLSEASDALSRSQNGTTVQAQLDRITTILNKFTDVVVTN